jgi:hypothetical protein
MSSLFVMYPGVSGSAKWGAGRSPAQPRTPQAPSYSSVQTSLKHYANDPSEGQEPSSELECSSGRKPDHMLIRNDNGDSMAIGFEVGQRRLHHFQAAQHNDFHDASSSPETAPPSRFAVTVCCGYPVGTIKVSDHHSKPPWFVRRSFQSTLPAWAKPSTSA